jgi:hypothetical protein
MSNLAVNRAVPIGVMIGFRREVRFPMCQKPHGEQWAPVEHDVFEHDLLDIASQVTFDESNGYEIYIRTDRCPEDVCAQIDQLAIACQDADCATVGRYILEPQEGRT